MTRLAALALCVLLVASACGGSRRVHGGSGVVTAGRVGSLQIDVSTVADIVAFAGKPDIETSAKEPWPGVPRFRALGYACPDWRGLPAKGTDCVTFYYVNMQTHKLAAFQTESAVFHTTTGIKPGMSQNTADRVAHQTPHGPWDAIVETSGRADLILASACEPSVGRRNCPREVGSILLESKHHPIGLTFT